MGYSTSFEGKFDLNKKLDEETYNYLVKFSGIRHMKRDLTKIMPKEEAEKYGVDGWKYVEEDKRNNWYDKDVSVVDMSTPPDGVPGLYCQWVPTEDGLHIEWDGGEKFYSYVVWLEFIIKNILAPKGYVLNGRVYWEGEESEDRGVICVDDNEVTSFLMDED